MKVKELRETIEELLERMEDYDDEQEVRVMGNTYFVGNYFIATREGYIDMYDLVKEEE